MRERMLCPKCSHTRKKKEDKCLRIDRVEGWFRCWNDTCDYKGKLDKNGRLPDVSTFKVSTYKPFQHSNQEYRPKRLIEAANSTPPVIHLKPDGLTSEIVEYFEDRGISKEVLVRNKITSEARFGQTWIMFPFFRNRKCVNVKYRTRKKNFRQVAGAEKIFYGLDDIKGCKTVIITEGEFDVLAFEEAGFENAISVPDGAPAENTTDYEAKFSYIQECIEELKDATQIILAVDNDMCGIKLREELQRRLGPERCWTVVWPDNCKDANDVLIKHGTDILRYVITKAKRSPIIGVFEVNDVRQLVVDLYKKGMVKGASTGWTNVDNFYTVREGEMTIVTGLPGSGKSEWIDALMVNLAEGQGWRLAIFSPENHPIEAHITKLVEKKVEKTCNTQYPSVMSLNELEAGMDWVQEHFYLFDLPDDELSITGIIDKAKAVVARYGIKGLCIDPWNEIDHSRPPGKTETEHISECLTKIRRFARNHRVHVWLVAHPTKMQKNDKGVYPVPTPYDISGCHSDDTEVLTDRGWVLHANIKHGDKICCFNPEEDMLEYHNYEKYWEYDYEGEMINLSSPSFNLMITPNHRMVIKPEWHDNPSFKKRAKFNGIGRPPRYNTDGWTIMEAQDLRSDLRMPFATNLKPVPDNQAYSDNYLMFLGWYVSEGSWTMGSISICQAVGELSERMESVIKALRVECTFNTTHYRKHEQPLWTARIKIRYCQKSKDFARKIMRDCGKGSKNIYLPHYIWSLSLRQKEVLLTALIEGDGSCGRKDAFAYHTISAVLCDQVQRLSIECGRMASSYISTWKEKDHHHDSYQVNIGRRSRKTITLNMKRHKSIHDYKGKVYCLTVPTGAYVTRRNRKVAISGNSAHFRNKADICLAVHRDMKLGSKIVEVHIQKVRFKEIGRIGAVNMEYNLANGRYKEGSAPIAEPGNPPSVYDTTGFMGVSNHEPTSVVQYKQLDPDLEYDISDFEGL